MAQRTSHNDLSDKPTETGKDRTLAVVNGKVIREADLASLAPASEDEALALLVDFALLDQEADRRHLSVSDFELENARKKLVSSRKSKSYDDASISNGRSKKAMDLQLRHALILQKLAAQRIVGKQVGMFHARGILVKYGGRHGKSRTQVLSFARNLQRRVELGADIAKLAQLNSEDELSGPHGGDLGVISSFGAPNLVHQTLDFNMQMALAHCLGNAKSNSVLRGPISGHVGYWILKIVSTQAEPKQDKPLYEHVLALYRSHWIAKYEPFVMMHLRASALINPPLDSSSLKPRPERTH